MSAMVSQITGVSIDCLINYSGADQRKYKSSASLAFVRGIHQWPVNFPHSGPVTRKMISFDDVIMCLLCKTSDCDSWRRTQNIEWYMTSHEWQYFWSQVGWFPNYFTNDTETYQQITSWLTRKSFYFAASYFCLITDIFLMSQGCIQISYMLHSLTQPLNACDVIAWHRFRHYWPFVRGIHQWTHLSKRLKCGAFVFSLLYTGLSVEMLKPNFYDEQDSRFLYCFTLSSLLSSFILFPTNPPTHAITSVML